MSMPLRLWLRQLSVTSNAACPSDMWGTDRVDWSLRLRRVRGIGKGSLDTSPGAGRRADVPLVDALASLDADLYVGSTLVVVTGARHGDWCTALGTLQRRGVKVICVVMDAASFGGASNEDALVSLAGNGVISYRVTLGCDISDALSVPFERRIGYDGIEMAEPEAEGNGAVTQDVEHGEAQG